jgi:hypothetical protein
VETCRPCQDQLERLTARPAWDKVDRATHGASESNGRSPDASLTGDFGGTTELDRATAVRSPEAAPEDPTEEGATGESSIGQRLGSTAGETAEPAPADPERTVTQSGAQPEEQQVPPRAPTAPPGRRSPAMSFSRTSTKAGWTWSSWPLVGCTHPTRDRNRLPKMTAVGSHACDAAIETRPIG